MYSTWSKIFELADSEDEMDRVYGEVLSILVMTRIEKGMTQSDLSRKSGLTTSMISKIEAQHSMPSVKTFFKYLKGLDMDFELKKGIR